MAKSNPDLFQMMQQQAAREQAQPLPGASVDPGTRERVARDVDEETFWIDRERLEPNLAQPRKTFPPDSLKTLGESLRADGQLQALVVRPHPEPLKRGRGYYQIVSGERRWQASDAKYGGIPRLRVTVRNLSDEEALRLGLIENLHREDLSPLDKADALRRLQVSPQGDRGDRSLRDLAQEVGVTYEQVRRLLALLELPKSIRQEFERLQLNEKHGRALLMLQGSARTALLSEIQEQKLSGNEALRRAEALRKPEKALPEPASTSSAPLSELGLPLQRGTGFDQRDGASEPASPTAGASAGLRLVGSTQAPQVGEARKSAQDSAQKPAEEQRDTATPPETPVEPPGVREFQAPLHRAALHLLDASVLLAEYKGGLPAEVFARWLQTIEEKRDAVNQEIARLRELPLEDGSAL